MADPRIDVACFGEVLWDIFDAEPGGEKGSMPRTLRPELGGAPANVATILARLGKRASIVGGVGNDRFGRALEKHLATDNVVTSHLVWLPNRTGVTFVARDANGEPEFLFYRQASADMALVPKHVTAAMGKARWGVVGSSTLMTESLADATHKFIDALDKAKGHLAVDLNVRGHLWDDKDAMKKMVKALVKRAALVKASERDLAELACRRGMSWLEENASHCTWVLTRGPNGAAAIGAHGQATAPTRRVRCVDATGGGDAFLSGVLAVLLTADARPGQKDWKDAALWTRALEVGHLLGAKAVGSVGAVSGVVDLEPIVAKIGAKRS